MRYNGDFSKWAKQVDGYTQHGNIKGEKKNAIYESVKKDSGGDKELAARVANSYDGKTDGKKTGASYIRSKLSGAGDPVQSAVKELASMVRGATSPFRHRNPFFKIPWGPGRVARPDLIPAVQSFVRGEDALARDILHKTPGLIRTASENEPGRVNLTDQDKMRIRDFLRNAKNIKDDDFHALAASMGVNKHKAEEYAYVLAGMSKGAASGEKPDTNKDMISGGKADKKSPSDFSPKSLAKGSKVEMEHTDSKALAKEITRDHLTEFPDYYEALDKMEKKLKEKKAAPLSLEELKGMVGADQRLQEQKRLDACGKHKQQPFASEDHKQASARQHGDFARLMVKAAMTDYAPPPKRVGATMLGEPGLRAAVDRAPRPQLSGAAISAEDHALRSMRQSLRRSPEYLRGRAASLAAELGSGFGTAAIGGAMAGPSGALAGKLAPWAIEPARQKMLSSLTLAEQVANPALLGALEGPGGFWKSQVLHPVSENMLQPVSEKVLKPARSLLRRLMSKGAG